MTTPLGPASPIPDAVRREFTYDKETLHVDKDDKSYVASLEVEWKGQKYTLRLRDTLKEIKHDEALAQFEAQIDDIILISSRYLNQDTKMLIWTPGTNELTQQYDKEWSRKHYKGGEVNTEGQVTRHIRLENIRPDKLQTDLEQTRLKLSTATEDQKIAKLEHKLERIQNTMRIFELATTLTPEETRIEDWDAAGPDLSARSTDAPASTKKKKKKSKKEDRPEPGFWAQMGKGVSDFVSGLTGKQVHKEDKKGSPPNPIPTPSQLASAIGEGPEAYLEASSRRTAGDSPTTPQTPPHATPQSQPTKPRPPIPSTWEAPNASSRKTTGRSKEKERDPDLINRRRDERKKAAANPATTAHPPSSRRTTGPTLTDADTGEPLERL
jgi:hypothetical protein